MSALDLLHLARIAAARAGAYLRSVQQPADPSRWTLKGSRDFVTEVDRTAERMIADILLGAEPAARMVGEELSPGSLPSRRGAPGGGGAPGSPG